MYFGTLKGQFKKLQVGKKCFTNYIIYLLSLNYANQFYTQSILPIDNQYTITVLVTFILYAVSFYLQFMTKLLRYFPCDLISVWFYWFSRLKTVKAKCIDTELLPENIMLT